MIIYIDWYIETPITKYSNSALIYHNYNRSNNNVCVHVCVCLNQSLIISAWMQTEVIAPDCVPPPQVWVEF